MKRYAYACDPVCLGACLLYALNRWMLPLTVKGPFLRNYFNDTLLIPAALPLVLWLHRQLGLRDTDVKPTGQEVWMHLVLWSIAAEVVGPHLFHSATGDVRDAIAYAAGSALAWRVWSGA